MATATTAPQTSSLMVNLFDGTRQPVAADFDSLIRVLDGNQNQVSADRHRGPNTLFRGLPFFDNLGDNYTVIVSADDCVQAGFTPVKLRAGVLQHIDLMLLPKDAGYNFRAAGWDALQAANPALAQLLAQGADSAAAASDRYAQLMENRPDTLAALLNITTAMAAIQLPASNPLSYFKELIWDDTMAQDRFFGWADVELVSQVRRAAAEGAFAPEVGTGFFHSGATSSFKQIQFGEANVQITFHENDTRTIDGVGCIRVEPDIDYFKDLGAHALLEVIPNAVSGNKTDPRLVYVLRWIAGRHAGVPEFNPPYVLA